MLPAMSPDRN